MWRREWIVWRKGAYVPLFVRKGSRLKKLAWRLGFAYDVVSRVP